MPLFATVVRVTLALLVAQLALTTSAIAKADSVAVHEYAVAATGIPPADLEELLAPIALYPDPLLANVLTAACYPEELAQAASGQGNSADWEPSVQAIAKIPDALKLLTDYPDWTRALGEAFILQSKDVMAAVQRLRARAYASGALESTEQQVVHAQQDTIIIQPAQPDVIYVPTYQPSVVYVDDDDDEVVAGVIGFGLGITAGLIIANNVDCDWHGGGCCYGCGWGHGDVDIDINRGDINIDNSQINNIKNNGNQWKPNQNKLGSDIKAGRPTSLNNYRGVSSGRATNATVPNRAAGAKPIAGRSAPKPSQTTRSRQQAAQQTGAATRPSAQPVNRPSGMQRQSTTPAAQPSIPPASQRPPAARPASGFDGARPAPTGSRPSAFSNSGNTERSASRGASSRGSRSAGSSRGGGGGRGGGRR